MVGIYKITSPSGRIYIGQAKDLNSRFKQYSKLQNCKGQTKLYRSFMKYGVENHVFEIIEECDRINLNNRERYWQDYYDVLGKNGLNCKLTKSDDKIVKHSLETRNKISKSNLDKKHSEESKLKISLSISGKNHPFYGKNREQEIRNKISQSHFGIFPNEETRLKMSNSAKRRVKKPFTKEHCENISKKRSGIPCSESLKLKLSKKVIDTTTGHIYDSVLIASVFFNLNRSTLTQYLGGSKKNKTTLRYLENL